MTFRPLDSIKKKKKTQMMMLIMTNRVSPLRFARPSAETEPLPVSPSRPVMNKSRAEPAGPTAPLGKRRQVLSKERARNLIRSDRMKCVNTLTDSTAITRFLCGLLSSILYGCRLFINRHVSYAAAAVTFSAVVHLWALAPF